MAGWVFIAARGLFLIKESRGYSLAVVLGLITTVSFLVAWALGTWASAVVAHRFSCCVAYETF